ncbi:MAG: hypothetical protein NVSMB65_08010 [Chloroflexota bacterium]
MAPGVGRPSPYRQGPVATAQGRRGAQSTMPIAGTVACPTVVMTHLSSPTPSPIQHPRIRTYSAALGSGAVRAGRRGVTPRPHTVRPGFVGTRGQAARLRNYATLPDCAAVVIT